MSKTYQMNLAKIPFGLIKNGKKVVEMRLNKDGRDKILPDDFIIFTNQESKETLKVKVISVNKFPDFKQLYAHFDKTLLGYEKDEIANPKDMNIYYSNDDIEKYGVLAIQIELVKI